MMIMITIRIPIIINNNNINNDQIDYENNGNTKYNNKTHKIFNNKHGHKLCK